MVRTQIQLTEQQARRLRAQARERGKSLAAIIRGYVEKGLLEETPGRAALYDRRPDLSAALETATPRAPRLSTTGT